MNITKNRKSLIMMVSTIQIMCATGYSQKKSSPYEVAIWPEYHEAAISYTFDDNCPNQLAVAIPLFNEYSYRTTLFIPTSWTTVWTGLQAAADKGHEIASHTVTHANLGGISMDQQISELGNSRDTINARIKGHSCRTIAYPYCVPGNDSLCSLYYIAARQCNGAVESKTPADLMNISSITTGAATLFGTVQDFNREVEKADSMHGWCVFLIHGIDNDGGYSPTESSVLRAHLEYVRQQGNKFWVAPFGDVVRYIRERNAFVARELSVKKSAIILQLSAMPDTSVYNYPLTIRRVLPKKWKSARAIQNGRQLKKEIVKKGSMNYITFNAVPGNGDILLIRE